MMQARHGTLWQQSYAILLRGSLPKNSICFKGAGLSVTAAFLSVYKKKQKRGVWQQSFVPIHLWGNSPMEF